RLGKRAGRHFSRHAGGGSDGVIVSAGVLRPSSQRRQKRMTSRQISLVQDSFRLVQPILEDAAILFYDRLFELDPSLRPLFHTPRANQAHKLAQALTIVVKSLDRPDQIKDAVEALGRRHSQYGARDEHYSTVGAAL